MADERFVEGGDGVRLHVVEAGHGPPMLLLHGFPQSWYTWRHQIDFFARRFRVVAPDLRGFNLSDKPHDRRAYRRPALLADLDRILDALGLRSATLVGHDLGGLVTWAYAAERSHRVDRHIAINCPHPALLRRVSWRDPLQLLRSSYVGLFRLPALPERLLRLVGPPGLRLITPDPAAASRYRAALARPGAPRGMLNHYRALPSHLRASTRTPIDVPTLLVWGRRDPFIRSALADASSAFARDFTLRKVSRGGHWVHESQPDVVNALIAEFCSAT